jgi:hypothetical protein
LVTFDNDEDMPQYAILSQRWGPEDVTFEDVERSEAENKDGYRKLNFCAHQASHDGILYFWVDACCIKKSDFPLRFLRLIERQPFRA